MLPRFNSVDELVHYASENYDPVKAHEYYLRNRELKGRRSTKGFNQKQKEGWQYAQAQVRAGKKSKTEAARNTEQQSIAAARAQATAVRQQISDQIRKFAESLSQQHSDNSKTISANAAQQRQAIADKLKADIAAVPEVPKGLPKARREKLQAERNEKLAALRGQAFDDRKKLDEGIADDRESESDSVKAARKSGSDQAAAQRAQVATQLKSVVADYIAKYKSAREQISSESEATLDKEFKNIKTKVR